MLQVTGHGRRQSVLVYEEHINCVGHLNVFVPLSLRKETASSELFYAVQYQYQYDGYLQQQFAKLLWLLLTTKIYKITEFNLFKFLQS